MWLEGFDLTDSDRIDKIAPEGLPATMSAWNKTQHP